MSELRSLKPAPKSAPGQGVANAIQRRGAFLKSDTFSFGDTTPMNFLEVPGNLLITGGYVKVETAFDAAGTSEPAHLSITGPNDTGTQTLWDSAKIGLTSTGFKAFQAACITPASGGVIIGTYTANTTTAGVLRVYLTYVELDDLL